MSQYLLLRDNKQTGPYSLEELVTKGLKPYDLVWLNGKSAAWRYPSEIAELQPYAPAVEEQPYDRFYKKPAAQQEAVQGNATPVADKAETTPPAVTRKETSGNITPKKIYVTMPAANGKAAAQQTNGYEAYLPKAVDVPVQKQETDMPAATSSVPLTVHDNLATRSFSEKAGTDYYSLPEEKILPPASSRRSKRMKGSKIAVGSLIAVCLILGGIVIGLLISNRQLKQQQDLDTLVKQIHEQEKTKQQPVMVSHYDNTAAQQQATAPAEHVPPQNNVTVSPAPHTVAVTEQHTGKKIPEAKKSKNLVTEPGSAMPSAENIPLEAKTAPAETNNATAEKEKNSYQQTALESARRNIYQLVAVEGSKYKTGVLGGIYDLHLTISNNSSYPIDQVAVEIRYLGMEKKMVKTQTIIFNDIAPGEQKTLEAPRTNRGISVDYVITRINSKILGLAQAGL